MKSYMLINLALLLQLSAKTQVTFEKIITKGSTETAWSVIQTADGGYAFLGSFGATPGYDRWLVKTDNMGDTLWSKTFRGIGNEDGDRSLVKTTDGGFTFIANRSGKVNLFHTSSLGDSLWEKEIFSGIGISIATTSNQGYVVTGPNASGSNINVAFAEPGGDIVWAKTYILTDGISSNCRSWTVREIPGNGFVVAGAINSNYGFSTPFILKIGSTGDSIWCRSYPWWSSATIYSTDTTGNNGFFVSGIEQDSHPNTMVMRLNSSGDTVWTRVQAVPLNQFFNCIRSTSDGGAIACGSFSNNSDSNKVYLVKYSVSGSIVWEKKIGKYKNAYGLSIESTIDSGYIICGEVQQTVTSSHHGLLIKTDSNGNLTGIENHVAEQSCYFYPNPVKDITTIRLANISNGNPVIIRLCDLFGREVKTTSVTQGLKGYTLDVANLPDGTYLAVIELNGQVVGRAKLFKHQ